MNKPIPTLSDSEAGLEIELARRRAMHHVRDAARILTDAMHYIEPARRPTYSAIVGSLSDLEQHLSDLEPKGTPAIDRSEPSHQAKPGRVSKR
jgi:hypothetical protein